MQNLLARCRQEGIDAAFAGFSSESSPELDNVQVISIPPDLQALLMELQGLTRPGDMPRRIQVCQAALNLVDRESQPELWAYLQESLDLSLRRLLGGLKPQVDEKIRNAVLAFLNAQTWDDRHQVVMAHREELLSEAADQVFQELLVHHRDNPMATQILKEHQALLTRCRREGIEAVFAAFSGVPSFIPPSLQALLMELQGLNRPSDMPRAIQVCQKALALVDRKSQPQLWAQLRVELANSLAENPQGERAGNLEEAIQHYQQALEVFNRESFPEDWAGTQNKLGIAFRNRIDGERAANLEQAIHHYRQALEVYTRKAFPADWAMIQNNLGNAFWERLDGERAANLEQAIHHYRQALEVYTRKDFAERWAATQNNLGLAFGNRIAGERAANLEQAIHHFRQALEVRTREVFPADWAGTQNNLGVAFNERLDGERAANLEQAIHHFQQALEVWTREAFPKDWGGTQNNLGLAFSERLDGERAANLEQAIHHFRQALEIRTREAFPADWAGTQNNLGVAFAERLRGERAANLEQAIHHFQQALEVRTREAFPAGWAMTQHNLGGAFIERLDGERAANLEQAIHHYQQALEVRTREAFPVDHRITLSKLGDLHFREERWEKAQEAYTGALAAGNAMLDVAYTLTGRRAEVGETSLLYASAAYCLLKLGKPDQALVRLEQGKTRLLTEALSLGQADLAELSPKRQEALVAARQTVRQLEGEMRQLPGSPGRRPDQNLAPLLQQARAGLRDLIESIRSDHPGFMPTGLDLPGLLKLIPERGALVAPLVTSQGGAAFVLPHGVAKVTADHVIPLNEFTEEALQAILVSSKEAKGWLQAYVDWKIDRSLEKLLAVIETVTRNLWDLLMGEVHQRLAQSGLTPGAPVIIMPQGGLGLLPLHAAWREIDGTRRAFLDDYTVTYAPSTYALSVSQGRLQEKRRLGKSLLAVVNPTRDLPFTQREGQYVASLFPGEDKLSLQEDQATLAAVREQAPSRAYLHFACHGGYDWRNVMMSELVLAGGEPLTLGEIISYLDLSASRLVVLSACETGLTEVRESPDEYLGLPAGFLQAGTPAVISSLWAVDDLSTAILFQQFYHGHLQDGLEPASALRQAQCHLRDSTAAELGLVDLYEQLYQASNRREALDWKRYYQANPDAKPFANPYYWAGFIFSGV